MKGAEIAKNGYKEEEKTKDFLLEKSTYINQQFKESFDLECNFKELNIIKGTKKSDILSGNKLLRIQIKKNTLTGFGQVKRISLDKLCNDIKGLKECKKNLESMIIRPILSTGKVDKKHKLMKEKTKTARQKDILLKTLSINKKEILKSCFEGYNKEYIPNIYVFRIYDKKKIITRIFKTKDIINYLLNFDFFFGKNGTTFNLNNIFSIQRKGGDNGKPSSNDVQFKVKYNKLANSLVKNGYKEISFSQDL